MKKWTVQLAGDPAILKWVADTLDDPNASIRPIQNAQGQWEMQSPTLAGLADKDTVFNECGALLLRIRGMAAIHGLPPSDIRVAAVFETNADGSGSGAAVLPFTCEVLPAPADKYRVSDLPTNDNNIETALRICAERALTWMELYKLLEVIQADKGANYPVTSGAMSQAQLKTFKHTANSMAAIGDDARHGPKKESPPSKPMTITEARKLFRCLLKKWLAEKKQSPATI